VVGYNGKQHNHAALAWGAEEAAQRDAPLLVLFVANYPGMTLQPGPGLLRPDPALEAAHEMTACGVSEALKAHPGLRIAGATEVTSPSRALTEASNDAALVVLGSRGYGRVVGALLGSGPVETVT
jgi:nucleotide-binding universal stress UspA family protein